MTFTKDKTYTTRQKLVHAFQVDQQGTGLTRVRVGIKPSLRLQCTGTQTVSGVDCVGFRSNKLEFLLPLETANVIVK